MALELPKLPFPIDALTPHMSRETLEFHHGKHHKAYIDKANTLLEGKDLAKKPLAEIVRAATKAGDKPLFNNVAQAWNHEFFWNCLAAPGKKPDAALSAEITKTFGSLEALLKKLSDEAVGHFGSGWAWLVVKDGVLAVTSYHDADTPIAHDGVKPLLTLDVWEHAYYIDYRNARPKFAEAVLNNIINWDVVAQQLKAAQSLKAAQ
jgi:Fe-Mn family superoxide dismutase